MDRELTPQELAYAAGILDGEGCIKLSPNSRGSRGYYLKVEIVNTNKVLIDWMHERFGGNVQTRAPKNPAHKAMYDLSLCSRIAASMLKLVRPYLIVKATEADIGILLQAIKRSSASFTDEQQAVEEYLATEITKYKKGGI